MARRNKKEERAIAFGRVERLVALAEKAVLAQRADRATRYAELAWRVKQTYQLRGSAIEGRRCRRCGAFFSARTVRVRVRDGKRVTTCLACGAIRRRPLSREVPSSQGDRDPVGAALREASREHRKSTQ